MPQLEWQKHLSWESHVLWAVVAMLRRNVVMEAASVCLDPEQEHPVTSIQQVLIQYILWPRQAADSAETEELLSEITARTPFSQFKRHR